MKGRLHYDSPYGSAEMVADAIGKEVNMIKEALLPAYMPEGIALMFLGCEGTKADKTTLGFISTMNPKRVANAALFCCNAKKSDNAINQMRDALKAVGVNVLDEAYVCNGKGGLFSGGKHPNADELAAAAKWARECVNKISD